MGTQKLYYTFPKTLPFLGIKSITFNGVNFILLDEYRGEIILLGKNYKPVKNIVLKRKYSNICFDNVQNCYWAISDNDACIIYQLDARFNEINQISLKNVIHYEATGISYDCAGKKIWIAFPSCTGYVKAGTDTLIYIQNNSKTMINRSVLSLSHCTLLSYKEDEKQFIEISSREYCRELIRCIPDGYTIEDMCVISCTQNKIEHFSSYSICLLLSQDCSKKMFIMRFYLKFCKNKTPELICEKLENMKPITDCNKHDNECARNAKYQIMQSIALEEAAIAHILNAEGEKIQKAVANFDDLDKLLCVNESVKQTIIHITQLETQLYLKLEALQKDDCCDNCHKKSCELDCTI